MMTHKVELSTQIVCIKLNNNTTEFAPMQHNKIQNVVQL